MTSRLEGNWVFPGTVILNGTVVLPPGSVGNSQVGIASPLDGSKTIHRHALRYGQLDGVNVAAQTQVLHIAQAPGTIHNIELRPTVVPAGGDLAYTVDVQSAPDGSAVYTSLLDAVISVDSAEVDETLIIANVIANPAVADGDAIRVVVAVSGATGTQGQGFALTINLDEEPV